MVEKASATRKKNVQRIRAFESTSVLLCVIEIIPAKHAIEDRADTASAAISKVIFILQ